MRANAFDSQPSFAIFRYTIFTADKEKEMLVTISTNNEYFQH